MASYQIMVVEDEELMADKMEMQIEKLGHQLFAHVDNSEDALAALEKGMPDLILMDIQISGAYDGIELTDMIHQNYSIPVIFISSQYDDNTFRRITRTNPIAFITKPFSDIQLQRTIEMAFLKLEQESPPSFELSEPDGKEPSAEFIFVKNRKRLEKIRIQDIFFLEADGRYCRIQLVDRKFLIRMSLKEVSLKLDLENFIQTHRSFIVNIDKIKTLDLEDNLVVLENMSVPISRREKEHIMEKLNWI